MWNTSTKQVLSPALCITHVIQARDCLTMLMFPPDVTSTPVAVDNNASALAGFSDNVGDMLLGSGI